MSETQNDFAVFDTKSTSSMAYDLTIRTATAEDIEILAQFNQKMARETEDKVLDPETVKKGVRALFDEPSRGFYLVAVKPTGSESPDRSSSSRILGSLMITTEWSDWRNGSFWWIQSVYVRPDARREGVYRTMHRDVRARAKSDETVCGLRLYVDAGNDVAQATYESLGMSETSYRMYEEML